MNGFYAGSFDPLTNGHLYVIHQAAAIFDEVVVGIGINPEKRRYFTPDVILDAAERIFARENLENVRAVVYKELTVERARAEDCQILVRGLRDGIDYGVEENLARANFTLGKMETMYFRAGETAYLSSSTVMELARHGADVSKLVPPEVAQLLHH